MEELHRTRYGERVQRFHVLSKHTTLPESPHVHQPRSSLSSILLGFDGDSFPKHDWRQFQPPAPIPSFEVREVGLKVLTLKSQRWFFIFELTFRERERERVRMKHRLSGPLIAP